MTYQTHMTYQTLQYVESEGILTLTLDRPQNLNAFTVQMAQELVHAFGRASSDDDVRAIIVTGAGRAFCAGMDLSTPGNVFGLDESLHPMVGDMHERLTDPDIAQGVRDTGGRVTLAIYECTKPVIAAINGAAVGIGATMTLAMDFRLGSTAARIGFVFGKLGIVPEACSTWFLPRVVGLEKALELTYSADTLDAAAALEAGLIREVCEPDDLLPAARALAQRFTHGRSPVAVALTRQMMYHNSAAPSPLEAHRIESLAMFYTSSADGREGVASFKEKRPPAFGTKTSTDMPPFYPWWPVITDKWGEGRGVEL